jgi:hypothetical protein
MGLFIAIDEQHLDGSHTTAFSVHDDRCEEAVGLVPLFCVIYKAKFGIASRQWFAEESKAVNFKHKWGAVEGQVVPRIPEDDEAGFDLESNDQCFTQMADLLNIDTEGTAKKGFAFDTDCVVDEIAPSKNQCGDLDSVKTFRDECIEIMDEDDNELNATPAKDPQRSPNPDSLTVQTDSAAQATSTLTEDTTTVDVATSLEQMMLKHPQLTQSLWTKNSAVLS